jgi:(p)ppGpp synthase/HD superfamily hydrolase
MDYAATILAKLPGTSMRRDHGFRRLIDTLETYMPAEQITQVIQAYQFGASVHEGQKRMSG